MTPDLAFWGQFLGWLAAELALVVVVVAWAARRSAAPQVRRAFWQAGLVGLGVVVAVETLGLRGAVSSWIPRTPLTAERQLQVTLAPSVAASPVSPEALPTPPASLSEPAARPDSSVWWPGWLWLTGAVVLLTRALLTRGWLAGKRWPEFPTDAEVQAMLARLRGPLRLKHVRLRVWPGLRGPVAFGWMRPTVAVPADFGSRFNAAQRETMLAHELAHLAAHDPFWLLVADLVCALAWWHPAVWWARGQFRAASEQAADEASALVPEGRTILAEALVRLGRELTAPVPAQSLGVAGKGFRSELARRVNALLQPGQAWHPLAARQRWRTRLVAGGIVGLLALVPWPGRFDSSVIALLQPSAQAAVPTITGADTATPRSDAENVNLPTQPNGSEETPGQLALHTRSFRLDPTRFREAIRATEGIQQSDVQDEIRQMMALCGLFIPRVVQGEGTPDQTTTAIYFADRRGILFVRASLSELDSVGRLLAILDVSEPSNGPAVTLEVQLAEVTASSSDDIGLDWLFGRSGSDNPGTETNRWNGTGHGQVRTMRSEGEVAVLTAVQYAALQERLTNRIGVDMLTTPPVTTHSGRQAQVAAQQVRSVVMGVEAHVHGDGETRVSGFDAVSVVPTNLPPAVNYQVESVPVGPVVHILPVAVAEDWHLTMTARVNEFLGYNDPGKGDVPTVQVRGAKPLTATRPLPLLRVREIQASAVARPGETVALRGARVDDLVISRGRGWLFRRAQTNIVQKRLFAFITLRPAEADSEATSPRPSPQPVIVRARTQEPHFRFGHRDVVESELANVLNSMKAAKPNLRLLIYPESAEARGQVARVQQEALRLGIPNVNLWKEELAPATVP